MLFKSVARDDGVEPIITHHDFARLNALGL
jgi:hypothetical protein